MAHYHVLFMKSRRWIRSNFSCKWHTTVSTRTLDSPSGWKRLPGKIFHQNSSGARTPTWNAAKKMTTRNCSTERTSLSTAKATPSTREIGEACTEAVTKYRNYNANQTDEEREHLAADASRKCRQQNSQRIKRWGEATPTGSLLSKFINGFRCNDR